MAEKQKKRIIALLLTLSTILSGWLLLSYQPDHAKNLSELSDVDTLLRRNLRQFNINNGQVKQVHHQIDSGFVRKEYYINVPPSFSQTQFHAVLNRDLFQYDIDSPARLDLNNRSMSIYLYYRDTIIRTVHLRMDPSLRQHKNPASILVAFDESASQSILRQMISIGEPIPMVFKVSGALEANKLENRYSDHYNHLAFWFKDREGANLLESAEKVTDLSPVRRFGELSPNAEVLSFLPDSLVDSEIRKHFSGISLNFIHIDKAWQVDLDQHRSSFDKILKQFEKQAKKRRHPVLLLENAGNRLEKVHNAILQLKKRGLRIVKPPVRSL